MQIQSLKTLLGLLLGISWLAQSLVLAHPVNALTSSPPPGQAYPCNGNPLNFAANNQGWIAETSSYGRVDLSATYPQNTLPVKLDLDQGHKSAQLYIDLYSTRPGCAQGLSTDTPWWEPGSLVSLWVWAPPGTRGDSNYANGLHLYAVDDKGKTLYGTWHTFQENTWFEVTMRLSEQAPVCGSLDPEFDFSHIRRLGLNVTINTDNPTNKIVPIQNHIWITPITIKSGVFPPPSSDHLYSFDEATNELPQWGIVTDKAWKAEAFKNAESREGALVIDADFHAGEGDDPRRKGVMDLVFAPDLDLGNSDRLQDFFSLDIKFDPPPDFSKPHDCPFTLKLWAFDSGKKVQFDSINQDVGSGEWTRVAFRLGDLIASTNLGGQLDLSRIGKIGLQIYDGTESYDYQGSIWIDNIALGSAPPLELPPSLSFVKTDGPHFTLDGQRFRFIGANAEYLPYKPMPIVEQVLDRTQSLGIRVIRTWGFGEGCEDYNLESCEEVSPYFQLQPGVYNRSALEHFDRIVYEAGKRNIRLIVPLVNNWYEHGGIPRYVCWHTQPGNDSNCNVRLMSDNVHDTFYTDPEMIGWYQDYVKYFVTHVNTITGIRYADDPTIMAWELINEPRARSDPSGKTLHQWIVDRSNFLAELAPNQLIGTGEEGWYIMPKEKADQSDGWQVFDKNYWHYGVNWADASCIDDWGSNGTDFLSDNSSTPQTVEWQKRVGAELSSPIESEERVGAPAVDFTGIHLYLSPGETGLSYAPYCYYYGLDALCSSPYDTTKFETTDDPKFNGPVHQAKEWIAQHVNTAHRDLNKPFVLEEFNFRVPSKTPLEVQADADGNQFQVTPEERARLFRQYLDFSYDLDVDGVLFWNLGYDGFMQQPWNEIEVLKQWIPKFEGTLSTDGSRGIRLDYDPRQGYREISMELSEPGVDWLRAEGNQVVVNLYNDGDAQNVVVEVQFAGDSIPRTKSIPIKRWENSFSLDELFAPVQKLESKTACPLPKEEPPLVTRIKITLQNFTSPGSASFNFTSIFNNKYVIYPGDPVEDVIRAESTRWAQGIPPVLPSVQINPDTCKAQVDLKEIVDRVVPIEFNFVGSIEHPDGYYYRYSIAGPKGQSESNLVSNSWKQTGQIAVIVNATGKYEVKIAPEGESFNTAGSCSFKVVNAAPVIGSVRIDDQEFQAPYDVLKPGFNLFHIERPVEIWFKDNGNSSAGQKIGCQLLKGNKIVDRELFPCQTHLFASISAKGYPSPIRGDLPPGQYELQFWLEGDKLGTSEISSLNIVIPDARYVYAFLVLGAIAVAAIYFGRSRIRSVSSRLFRRKADEANREINSINKDG